MSWALGQRCGRGASGLWAGGAVACLQRRRWGSRSFLQTLQDEIRVARAGKASTDYRHSRDAESSAAAIDSAGGGSASAHTAGTGAATSEAQHPQRQRGSAAAPGGGAAAVLPQATQPPRSRQAPDPDPDLLLHPSRARGDLNAYARGPNSTAAAGPPTAPAASAGARSHAALQGGTPPLPPPPPPLAWQAEDVEDLSGWQPVTYGESGIEAMVERRIRDSVARGELDNLKGRGQPLEALRPRHDAQFYTVDPLMAALSRSMGAQAVKPRSLELRDELTAARREFEQAVAAEARRRAQARPGRQGAGPPRAVAAAAPVAGGNGDSDCNVARSSGGSGSGGSVMKREQARRIGEELAAADLPGLAHRFEEVCQLRAQYNGAVLADKETYGAGWPLEQLRRLEYGRGVAAAAEAALMAPAAAAADRGANMTRGGT
ncbi:hypothetical protein HXX76_013855 [Chlamydomonas incerta]|uniref:DnaJ homologue subfamily C member 28 conserved domain-containing protein n=1 Tax=Chlamydomonas incerta TaxID=51695 RepID=A0A835SDH5_CHLIN|nr:hypothetical protein HXX76_013855 [Chlamydomonas incerta]|eukprot:KAG2425273.1 hypothetical protein HXX76_013855 [Chlamydomonas incerta]